MELLGIPLAVCVPVLVLLGALGIGAVVLVKLGVIAKYFMKEEPPDYGDYGLDQSHESGEK